MRRKSLTNTIIEEEEERGVGSNSAHAIISFIQQDERSIRLSQTTHTKTTPVLQNNGSDKLMKQCGACATYSGKEKREGTGRNFVAGRCSLVVGRLV
jgi:hypothetical protein